MKDKLDDVTVCVVGLGYVGLPLAEAFAEHFKVIGFDTDPAVIARGEAPRQSPDSRPLTDDPGLPTPGSFRHCEERSPAAISRFPTNLTFTANPEEIRQADFIIIAVPTPVTKSREPDLSCVKGAAGTIGRNMKKGSVVILESTVYPGVTEEVVRPILAKESGLQCGQDFKVAYSPERINPGDEAHAIGKITKVVAGMDEETTGLVAELYGRVATATFKARDIKTAEAAKVIENVQRDLNIALMNELSLIFEKMGLCTGDVLDAAATKWNFHRYSPGLVGGHCIPVDPYYLVYKAKELGHHPQVILAGRATNDYMPKHVAGMTIKALNEAGKVIKGSKVLIMGLTYKENVADTRETPVKGIIRELKEYGVDIYGCDPLLDNIENEFGIKPYDFGLLPPGFLSVIARGEAPRQSGETWSLRGAQQSVATKQSPPGHREEKPKLRAEGVAGSNEATPTSRLDAVILAVAHDVFKEITLDDIKAIMNANPILIDIRGFFNSTTAEGNGFYYRSL